VIGVGAGAAGVTGDDFAAETPIVGGTKATSDAEYVAKMEEEQNILSKWRRRAAYERTNPE
jgi:hypothetical protein